MATPDDRREKVREIKEKMENTLSSINETEKYISKTTDWNTKERMRQANNKRQQEVQEMKSDIEYENKPAE